MALLSEGTQRRLNAEDRHWRIQLVLRAFATFLAFPALILFAAATSESREDYGGNDWVDAFPIAPVLLALLYNPIHMLLTTSSTLHRPIHPLWPLLLDLHIWAIAVPALVFSVGDGWFWYWAPATYSIDGDIILCSFEENFRSEQCNPMIYVLGRVEIAANVFLALILIAHFILFIYSCIATHRYRLSRSRSNRARRNIELTYHRDPTVHAATAPSRHAPSGSISKSVNSTPPFSPTSPISASHFEKDEEAAHGDKAWESSAGGGSPHPAPSQPAPVLSTKGAGAGGGWARNADGAPVLASPVSPVNSGSGGGFMGGEGPFGDEFASERGGR